MRDLNRRLAAGAAAVALGLGAGAGTASAGSTDMPSGTALVNGATMLGCQFGGQEILQACTEMELLTTDDPALLTVNPFTTDIVILGAGLYPDGGIRPVLEERLRTGLRLANDFPFARVVVTGGVPQNGRTEAQAMSEWLRGAGVAPHRISEENQSNSTVQNAQFSNRLFYDRGTTGAVIVTNDFHLKRAMLNFRQAVDGRIPVAGVVARG
ncbi:YdcF family protein [Dietzia sp. 179-F 9C3 NHS]|uniref:YdcF family protein n=1 Tax=Dietzia sp. 179-F 9C3 NHS TaxID=3374295 RepID=UPI0038792FD1